LTTRTTSSWAICSIAPTAKLQILQQIFNDSEFNPLCTGNTDLGGEDFDQRLMEYCMSQSKRHSGIDVSDDKRAKQRLRKQCENAKRTLSNQTSATIEFEALANGQDFSTTMSRPKI
jgi:molecular chaperone DnaK (HSP70)